MRILKIHNRYRQPGGERVTVRTEYELLSQAGHIVDLYQIDNPTAPAATATALAGSMWNPVSAWKAGERAAAFKPDVAHVHNTKFALSPSVITALHRRQIPVLMTLHNYRLICVNGRLFREGAPCTLCVGTHPWQGVRYRCYRDSTALSGLEAATTSLNRALGTWAKGVSAFVTLSSFAREQFIAGGVPSEKISVVPNPAHDPGPRLVPPSDSSVVLFIGRLTEEKGIGELITAWDKADRGDLQLWVVGEGPMRPQLEDAAGSDVRFLGQIPVERVQELMLSSRASLVTSLWYEPFGRVILESLATGLPVMCTPYGLGADIPSFLGEQWSLDPSQPSSWDESLASLTDATEVDAAGRAARAAYEANFTPAHSVARLETALQSAIDAV